MANLYTTTPKYARLRDVIRNRIQAQEWQPGSRIPSQSELMRDFSASYSTVTRAINDLCREGLLESQQGKGTFVKRVFSRTANVAVTFNDAYQATHPWVSHMLRGIAQGVEKLNWHFQIFPLAGSVIFAQNQQYLLTEMIEQGHICGLIANSAHPVHDIYRLQTLGIPVVTIQNEYPHTHAQAIMTDFAHDLDSIFRYLTDLGHRDIRVIGGINDQPSDNLIRASQLFVQAAQQQYHQHDLPFAPSFICYSNYQWSSVMPTIRDWLLQGKHPTALVFSDDLLALQALKLARQLKLNVPEDISIVSWGNILHDSILTTVAAPLEAMGQRAVERLTSASDLMPPQQRFPGKLVIRDSSGPAKKH